MCFFSTTPYVVQTGAGFERAAVQALSQVFTKLELLREKPKEGDGYDLFIEFPPPDLTLVADCGPLSFGRPVVEAKALLHVRVTDRKDQLLLDNTYSSSVQKDERVSDAVGKALADVLGAVNTSLATASKIRTYAKALTDQPESLVRASGEPRTTADHEDAKVTGIGFAVGFDYILTAYHVVAGMSRLAVSHQEKAIPASLVLRDRVNDIALLKLAERESGATLSGLRLGDASQVKPGDRVWTLDLTKPSRGGGNAHLEEGTIHALSGVDGDPRFLQVHFPAQPEQSGAPLLNGRGEVIAIAISPREAVSVLGLSQPAQPLQLAVKIQYAKSLLALLPESEYVFPPPATHPLAPSALAEAATPQLVLIYAGR